MQKASKLGKTLIKPVVSAYLLMGIVGSIHAQSIRSFDYKKLQNDKELFGYSLSRFHNKRIAKNYPENYALRLSALLHESIQRTISNSKTCNLEFISNLFQVMDEHSIDRVNYVELLGVLRAHNLVDDLLFDLVIESGRIYNEIANARTDSQMPKFKNYVRSPYVIRKNNLYKKFQVVQHWPNGKTSCVLDTYESLYSKFNHRGSKLSKNEKHNLNLKALELSIIDLDVYTSLETLLEVGDRTKILRLRNYISNIHNAKNKMVYGERSSLEEVKESYTNEQRRRLKRLNGRENLYLKYNPTQIVMLAQVFESAAIRMGIDPNVDTDAPVIVTNYVVKRGGKEVERSEEYELSPSEQALFARKRLRKDIIDLQGTDSFNNVRIEYQDLVFAALETGYISIAEIEYALTYDDLWNSKRSFWSKFKSYLWSFGGTASLYLPPPWNIVGAIGLVFVNVKLEKGRNNHENHENPANIFD